MSTAPTAEDIARATAYLTDARALSHAAARLIGRERVEAILAEARQRRAKQLSEDLALCEEAKALLDGALPTDGRIGASELEG